MPYIVGIKATGEILTQSSSVYKDELADTSILINMVSKHGGVAEDYDVYGFEKSSSDGIRIFKDKAIYTLTWDNNIITGVDFTEYDTWKQMDISADKTSILPDDSDTAIITFTMYEADGVTIDESFESTIDVKTIRVDEVDSEIIITSLNFSEGIATIPLTSTEDGVSWIFLAGRKKDILNELKLQSQISIKVSS